MTRSSYRQTTFLFMSLSALAAAAFACSEGSAEPLDGPPVDGGPSDARLPGEEDGEGGAERDASADAPADAIEARTCTDEGWCHTALPSDRVLRAVWSDGHGTAWAVTDQGDVLRYDGAAWSVSHTRSDGLRLLSIWGSGPTDIWVGGESGFLHGTGATPATITWTEVALPAAAIGESVVSIYGIGPGDIYAATGPELLHYQSADGWSIDPVSLREDNPKFTAVWGRLGHDDLWVSTVSTAYGMSIPMQRATAEPSGWTYAFGMSEITIPNTYCWDPGEPRRGTMVADGDIWLIGTRRQYILDCYFFFHGTRGDDPHVYTFDGRALYDTFFRHNDIWGTSKDGVWSVGDHGTLQRWDGTTWRAAAISLTNLPVENDFYAIDGSGPGDIWVVGDRIALHKVTP